jgi:hypothetical protein
LSRNALRRGGKVKERIRLQNCIWRASSNFGELFFLEAAVSHSFFSADRPTHFKIVAIAVACSVAVTLFCLTARPNDQTKIATPAVIKAKTGIVVTSDDAKATR